VIGLLVGNGPIMQFTFGVLLPPIAREFGWARGTVSSAIVVGLWMTGIATPLVGRLVDRYGIRAVALPAIALFSAATASVALVPASPVAFTALYALMGLAAAGQTPLIYAKAISGRFDADRGLALGIAMAGVGIGAALVPQFAQALVQAVGWRGAYVGLGSLTFLLAFPAVALFLRGASPRHVSTDAAVAIAPIEASGLSGREAIRTQLFWRLAAAFVIVAAAANGTIAHMVPLLTDRGIGTNTATSVLSAAGLALVAGRLLAGYLLDRIFAPYVAVAFRGGDRDRARGRWAWRGSGPGCLPLVAILRHARLWRDLWISVRPLHAGCRRRTFRHGRVVRRDRLVSIDAGFFRDRSTPGERAHNSCGILCVSVGISALSG
jgi:MFS family permease